MFPTTATTHTLCFSVFFFLKCNNSLATLYHNLNLKIKIKSIQVYVHYVNEQGELGSLSEVPCTGKEVKAEGAQGQEVHGRQRAAGAQAGSRRRGAEF